MFLMFSARITPQFELSHGPSEGEALLFFLLPGRSSGTERTRPPSLLIVLEKRAPAGGVSDFLRLTLAASMLCGATVGWNSPRALLFGSFFQSHSGTKVCFRFFSAQFQSISPI